MSEFCKGCWIEIPPSRGGPERIWCSQRCRRRTLYAGTCESCGEPTDGSNGREQAPDFCKHCAPAAHSLWSRERIIEKMQEWTVLYGRSPSALDWNLALARNRRLVNIEQRQRRWESGEWPMTNTVAYHFGSWSAGLEAAGLASNPVASRWGKEAA